MHAVIRKYSGHGASELFDLLEKNKSAVESTMRSVKGLVSYTIARTDNGGFSVTVCQDQASIDQSTKAARDWVAKNAAQLVAAAPEVLVGTVVTTL